MSRLVPETYLQRVYGVFKTDCTHAEKPLAVFSYPDWAEKWAMDTYGKLQGRSRTLPDSIVIVAMKVKK